LFVPPKTDKIQSPANKEQNAHTMFEEHSINLKAREARSSNRIRPKRSHGQIGMKRKKEKPYNKDSPHVSLESKRSIFFSIKIKI
jgi:hypothetical protein